MTIQTVNVATAAQLQSALAAATGGETIILAAGDYGTLGVYHERFASNVTIKGGTFTNVYLSDVANVTFDGITVNYPATATSNVNEVAFQSSNADNIHLTNSKITGALAINGVLDTATAPDATGNVIGRPFGKGISLNYTTNSSVTNTEVSLFAKGISFSTGSNLTIDNNFLHDMRVDDIEGSVNSGLLITNNRLEQSTPWNVVDHPDRIHIFTGTTPITGLVISGNITNAGTGDVVQGIYLDDNHKGLGFPGAVITNNTVNDSSAIGMLLENVSGATISGNTLNWSGLGDAFHNAPRFQVQYSSTNIAFTNNVGDVTIANTATNLNFVHQTGAITEDAAMSIADRDTIISDYLVITGHNSGTLNSTQHDMRFEGGTGDFVGTGNALANHITGGSGNDTLIGMGGADILEGLLGNDTYVVDNAAQQIWDTGGTDLVKSSVSWTLIYGLENLTYTGTLAATLTGNSMPNIIIGGKGNDTLIGGGGADTLQGGLGNDTYVFDSSGVTIIDTGGTDTIKTSIANYTLQTGIENLTATGTVGIAINGNSAKNVLTGNSGNNILDGKTGADTMYGGAGDDTYIVDNVGDKTIEVIGVVDSGGYDTVKTALASWTLTAGVEKLWYTGAAAFTGTGSIDDNYIQGGNANDTLSGGAGNDTLVGNGGDDILIGGAGTDTLIGGKGNDTFVFTPGESNGDIISDFNGNGTAVGDLIEIRGWGAGSTFTNVVPGSLWAITDGVDGHSEYVTMNSSTFVQADVIFTQIGLGAAPAPGAGVTALGVSALSMALPAPTVDPLAPVASDPAAGGAAIDPNSGTTDSPTSDPSATDTSGVGTSDTGTGDTDPSFALDTGDGLDMSVAAAPGFDTGTSAMSAVLEDGNQDVGSLFGDQGSNNGDNSGSNLAALLLDHGFSHAGHGLELALAHIA